MLEVNLFAAIAVGALILAVYHHISKRYQYFLSKPVPCMKPTFLVGNSGPMLTRKKDIASHIRTMYDTYPDAKMIGFYDLTKPVYLVRDPEVVKTMTVKDFEHFTDHTPTMTGTGEEVSEKSLFGNSLFALRGQKWRDMRSTLSPAFTGSKMRHMFELVVECGQSMAEFLISEAKAGKRLEFEMKDTFTRFGNDVIATVAFGIKVDSMRDRENEFYMKGKQLLNFQRFTLMIKFLLMRAMPALAEKLGADFVDAEAGKYFTGVIMENMKQRKAHGIVRNDMIHMLMEVRKGALKHEKGEQETKDAGFATVEESQVGKTTHSRIWKDNELVAQCFIFFLAGFDTLSTGLTFLTYELALNPEIQQRLYEEVMETESNLDGKPLTYEVLQQMKYMDMVISESLRKWPPGIVADRYCTKDYQFKDGPGSFLIEKGTSLWIPTIAIHNDPRYYPNPDKFDPERFSDENKSKINPAAYIPFGVGPRNCIGSRLALMEMKSVVYYLLREFSFEPTEKTQIPLKLTMSGFTLQGEKGVWLEFKPRSI
ncbi:AAEL006815-PA [Aedes aegypti]|uniref:AAEL006815-PA n=2 Tax=Aedes aegypti TaxID=7159 RepID=A0A1S4FEM9_AEDAE|nr:probable cytochrome P450 9f2 [Aedes aegypti]EAT41567.1 AAEL006815-PA [Aedes aegypti]